MKYENASEILPAALLKDIQKYAAGKLLYVPSGEDKKTWGEISGYREQLHKRNQLIRNKYDHGVTVTELADEYFLSLDSIKRILYSNKKQNYLVYAPTIASAIDYANAGMLEAWLESYFLLTEKNCPKAETFKTENTLYFGVIKLPLRLIAYNMDSKSDDELSHKTVQSEIESQVFSLPLLIEYKQGKFYCMSQHHLLAQLKHHKVNAYPSIVVLQGNTEYKRYMQYYGNVFKYANEKNI